MYRARDPRLERDVAIKVLSETAAAQPRVVERFRREAQALAALDHPAIVSVHSVEEADGRLFITMGLIEGRTLGDHIPEGGMEADRWLTIARAVVEGLAAVHARGLVHRDLKPSNIMVTNEGQVKLVDFGLAKTVSVGGLDTVRTALTQDGTVVGTVPYMSPEQLRGRTIDERSDIFSLGVVLYEMGTGRHPFPGDNQTQVIAAILEARPEPMSGPCLALDVPVRAAIERCLVKAPAWRYGNAEELLADLTSPCAHVALPPTAEPPRRDEAPEELRPVLRHPARPSLAILPFENLSGDSSQDHLATGLWFDLNAELIKLSGLFLLNGGSVQGYKGRDVDPRRVGEELGVRHLLLGAVRRSRERLRLTVQLVDCEAGRPVWAEAYDRDMDDLFALQDEVNAKILDALHVTLFLGERQRDDRLRNLDARELYYQAIPMIVAPRLGDLRRARKLLRRAAELEPESSELSGNMALTYFVEGVQELGDDPAEALTEASLWAERAIAQGDLSGVGVMVRAVLLLFDRQYEAALEAGELALAQRQSCPWVYAILGNIHNFAGTPERAIELVGTAFRLSPFVPYVFPAVMATAYYLVGKPAEAALVARRALDLDDDSVDAHVVLAASLVASGREEDARKVAATLRRVRPDFSLERFGLKQPFRDPAPLEALLADARQAGL